MKFLTKSFFPLFVLIIFTSFSLYSCTIHDYPDTGVGNGGDTPPSLSIQSPSEGSTIGGNVRIVGTASDNSGISRIEIVLGTLLIILQIPLVHLNLASQTCFI